MTDLEKELVEKLAKALGIALDKPYSFSALVARELLPLIRSHTQALVAAAYAECEREWESVRADTIMRFRKVLDRLNIHGYYNEMQSEFGCEEASLSKPAPVERSNENG